MSLLNYPSSHHLPSANDLLNNNINNENINPEQLHQDLFKHKLQLHNLRRFEELLHTRAADMTPSDVEAEAQVYAKELEKVRQDVLASSALADRNFEQARQRKIQEKRGNRRPRRSASVGSLPAFSSHEDALDAPTDSSYFGNTTDFQSFSEVEREFKESERRLYQNPDLLNQPSNGRVPQHTTHHNSDPVAHDQSDLNLEQIFQSTRDRQGYLKSPSPTSRSKFDALKNNPLLHSQQAADPISSRPSSVPIQLETQQSDTSTKDILSLKYSITELQILLQQRNVRIETLAAKNQALVDENELLREQLRQAQSQNQDIIERQQPQPQFQPQEQEPHMTSSARHKNRKGNGFDTDPEDDHAALKRVILSLRETLEQLTNNYKLPLSIPGALKYIIEGLSNLSRGKPIDEAVFTQKLGTITRTNNSYYHNNDERIGEYSDRIRQLQVQVFQQDDYMQRQAKQIRHLKRAVADLFVKHRYLFLQKSGCEYIVGLLRQAMLGYLGHFAKYDGLEEYVFSLTGEYFFGTSEMASAIRKRLERVLFLPLNIPTSSTRAAGGGGSAFTSREPRKRFRALALMVLAAVRLRNNARAAQALRHAVKDWVRADDASGADGGDFARVLEQAEETVRQERVKRLGAAAVPAVLAVATAPINKPDVRYLIDQFRERQQQQQQQRQVSPVKYRTAGTYNIPAPQQRTATSRSLLHGVASNSGTSSTVSTEKDATPRY